MNIFPSVSFICNAFKLYIKCVQSLNEYPINYFLMQKVQRQRSRDKKHKKNNSYSKIQEKRKVVQIKLQENSQKIDQQEILRKHHKFIRENQQSQEQQISEDSQTIKQRLKQFRRYNLKQLIQKQGQKLAKKYYSKLYKQYAVVDLSRYQTGQIGCRWRSQKQVIDEKGEVICAAVDCNKQVLNTFQMNFGYIQDGVKKNALVKVSVCRECADKLNYKKKLKIVQKKLRKIEAELNL